MGQMFFKLFLIPSYFSLPPLLSYCLWAFLPFPSHLLPVLLSFSQFWFLLTLLSTSRHIFFFFLGLSATTITALSAHCQLWASFSSMCVLQTWVLHDRSPTLFWLSLLPASMANGRGLCVGTLAESILATPTSEYIEVLSYERDHYI